jgi:hypothetical protein
VALALITMNIGTGEYGLPRKDDVVLYTLLKIIAHLGPFYGIFIKIHLYTLLEMIAHLGPFYGMLIESWTQKILKY